MAAVLTDTRPGQTLHRLNLNPPSLKNPTYGVPLAPDEAREYVPEADAADIHVNVLASKSPASRASFRGAMPTTTSSLLEATRPNQQAPPGERIARHKRRLDATNRGDRAMKWVSSHPSMPHLRPSKRQLHQPRPKKAAPCCPRWLCILCLVLLCLAILAGLAVLLWYLLTVCTSFDLPPVRCQPPPSTHWLHTNTAETILTVTAVCLV